MAHVINSTQTLVNKAYDYYLWTLSLSDRRTRGWPLVDSPVPTVFYTMIYLFIVWIGPKFMANRKPFKLTWLLIPYNLSMAALNAYIAAQLFTASARLRYSYICEPCRERYHPDELQIANAVWWYYFSKLLEFCDTFFFILRKKDRQLTFLHVYHHSTMFGFWWIGIKWVPSGSTFLPAMVNSGIHVLMYLYYGLSVFGPQVTQYLWWKKYLTILQLIQFTCALILGANGLRTGCEFPLWMHYTLIIYMMSFIVLFGNFYVKAYMEKDDGLVEDDLFNPDLTSLDYLLWRYMKSKVFKTKLENIEELKEGIRQDCRLISAEGNQVFFGMDVGCGQGNRYMDTRKKHQIPIQSHNGVQNDKKYN